MEALGIAILLLLLAGVLIVPLALAARNYSLVKVNVISITVCSLMLSMAVFWPELFKDIRLELMGFDLNGMSDAERARNVAPGLREEATKLYWSYMGTGWPLKAIMVSVLMLPYPTMAYFLVRLVKLVRGKSGSR